MSGPPKSGPVDEVRQHIISSLFSRKAEDGTPEETLISYVKVYEDESGADVVQPGSSSAKTRYLMLAVTKHGKVVMHKAKRNNNLSFSKGKTWSLEDMRVLEVIGPTDFALTMTIRRYHWATDKAKDQMHFLNSVVKVYRTYTKGEVPELINFNPPPPSATGPPPNGSGERQPSFSSQSPLPRNMDLAPPQMLRQHRSGSSTSITSAQSSAYGGVASESSFSRTRSRPSLDEPRAGSSLGKSPLADSNMPPRRPMINQVQSSRSPPSSSHGLGMGMPSNGRRKSEERLGDQVRKASAASEYGEGSSIPKAVRRPSNDMRAIAETEDRPSSRSNSRGNLAADAMERPGSSRSNGDREREREKPKPSPLPPAPTGQLAPVITTTLPSPSIPQSSQGLSPVDQDRRPQRRKSFHPAPVNTAFSREVLLTSRTNILPGAAGLTLEGDKMATEDALLANVEEMLEGFDWTAGVGTGESKKAGADAIESRLLDELAALDSANIHAFLESDDRIAQVLGHIDEALLEMDEIDAQITGYRMQLNAVSDDISYIESQNRGLQVQTSNQQALLTEIRQLLQIVEVPSEDLRIITHESPGTQKGVQNLEKAVASLYKALQAGQDQANAEVSATIARMKEYEENSAQFCKRVFDYLDVTFKYQSDQTLSESRKSGKKNIQLNPHTGMCEFLMMYEGLVLYLKEMDELRYQKLCSNYMSTISSLHQNEMKDMLMNLMGTLNASNTGEPNEASFATAAGSMIPKTSALQKSKAVVGLKATDSTIRKEKKGDDNAHRVSELYQTALTQIVNQVLTEESFINAFLHLTDTESTFADHMELDSYFRRQAARHAAKQMSPGLMQLIRSMMDLVFGFVDVELKNWSEAATERNAIAVVGLLGVTERLAKEAEEEDTSIFFAQLFDRQLARQRAAVEAFAVDQIKVIDNGRNTVKRRRAVAFFVKHFPVFVEKMEAQLVNCDGLPVRSRVNDIYERIVNAIFGTVQQIAKLDRAESQTAEDKGQLNYNVVVIENMHHFVEDVSQLNLSSLGVFVERARGLYRENMTVYVKMLLRRSFGRMMDFFDGVEKLLSTTPASEVHLHNAYSRSNLKKILKDYGAKDMRKAIETMTRRVDKHFGGDDADPSSAPSSDKGALISIVWKEVTAGLKNETARAADIIKRSYGDSGLSMEYGPADVEASCKRAKQ